MRKIVKTLIIAAILLLAMGGQKLMAQNVAKNDSVTVIDDGQIIRVLRSEYTEPQFPGGMPALGRFINANVEIPQSCRENGTLGSVFCSFLLNADSTITDIRIERSPHELLTAEALRLIRLMPKWEPACVKGKPIRTRLMLPIVFQ